MLKLSLIFVSVFATTSLASLEAKAYDGYGLAGVGVGTQVQVYSGGGWSHATVVGISGSSLLVRYLDDGWSGDEWVDASQVSLVAAPVYAPTIEVYYGNQWFPGVVLSSHGGRHHVRYRGVDRWFDSHHVRHRGGRAYHAPRGGFRHGDTTWRSRSHHRSDHGWRGGSHQRDNRNAYRGNDGRRGNDKSYRGHGGGRSNDRADRGGRGGRGR